MTKDDIIGTMHLKFSMSCSNPPYLLIDIGPIVGADHDGDGLWYATKRDMTTDGSCILTNQAVFRPYPHPQQPRLSNAFLCKPLSWLYSQPLFCYMEITIVR